MFVSPRTKHNPVLHINSQQHLQFGQLQQEVSRLLAGNRQKYQRILDNKALFKYQLIKINENKSISLNFGRELLMKQVDRLMEEESYLNKELSMISFQIQQGQREREQLIEDQVSPLATLNTLWNSNNQHDNAFEHAQALNYKVGSIKMSIRRLLQTEKDTLTQTNPQLIKNATLFQQLECPKCQKFQESKKQLRADNLELREIIRGLNEDHQRILTEMEKKNESIRQLNRRLIESETQANSRVMYLEEKLLMEDHQVKQLKKFRNELEKNMFQNPNYQVYVKTNEDLTFVSKNICLQLEDFIEFLSSNVQEESLLLQTSQERQPMGLPSLNLQDMSQDQLLLELALPIGKTQSRRTPMTERPKTDRRRSAFNQQISHKLEDLQNVGKKYMRTNQLTSKRNRPSPYTPIESKMTNSTLKLSDSPKSIQQA